MGVLFALGAACFAVAAVPGFVTVVGSGPDAVIYFAGSVFFTTAAAIQWRLTDGRGALWWGSAIQFAGTILFNLNTFRAMQSGLDAHEYDRLVWTPDVLGCICFLVSGWIAFAAVRPARATPAQERQWRIAAINLAGCVAFAVAAIGGYVVPRNGDTLSLAAANGFTCLGGLCFLVGAVLGLAADAAEQNGAAPADVVAER
jgi:hypothetical protein